MNDVAASASKAAKAAARIEAARACQPRIDHLQALRRSLAGGNHGTAAAYGADRLPPPTLPQRLVGVIGRALVAHRAAQAPAPDLLTLAQRRRAAASYREWAAQMEAGRDGR
jgi:hypothetical protein